MEEDQKYRGFRLSTKISDECEGISKEAWGEARKILDDLYTKHNLEEKFNYAFKEFLLYGTSEIKISTKDDREIL